MMDNKSKPSRDDVVVIAARRTPQGKLLGQLSPLSAVDLGATAIRAALEDISLDPGLVDHVVMGQVIQAGAGQNPARQSAVAAGLPLSTPAATVNSLCLSGLRAIIDASFMLRVGDADVIIAGGQESMSNAPHLLTGARKGVPYGSMEAVDSLERDGLVDAFNGDSMGLNTDMGNAQHKITREQQDEIAVASHQRAASAWDSGVFDEEVASVSVPQKKGPDIVVSQDEGIRPDSSLDTLGKLRPAFRPDGTITAGNSSPISDGAAAVILTTRSWAESHGITPLATLDASAHVAGPDTSLHLQPAAAITKALDRAHWDIHDLDFAEVNEAFAAVVAASLSQLGMPLEKTNIHGGAVALGHPIGASGARLVTHAVHELSRRENSRAAVALCGGGGQGDALLLKN